MGGVYVVEEVQEFNNKPTKEAELIKDEYSNTSYNINTDTFESDKKDSLENKEKEAEPILPVTLPV